MYTANKIDTFHPACRCRHGPSRVLVIFCLLLAINAALPSAGLAAIKVEPGTTVQVGEEVYFDGSGVTIAGAALLDNGMVKGSYEWDFGDDFFLTEGIEFHGPYKGGTSVVHSYMRPGTYTVTLNVTDINGKNKIDTIPITVEGIEPKLPPRPSIEPILELKFENNLDDTSTNGLTAQWVDGTGSFVRGMQGQAVDLTNGAYIEVLDPNGILAGMDEFTVSVWARKDSNDTTGYLLDKSGVYYISVRSDPNKEVRGQVDTTGGKLSDRLFGKAEIFNKRWHHYVMTYNGSQVRVFVDGIQRIEAGLCPISLTGTVEDSTDSLLIGKRAGVEGVFEGYIDEVKIYNKALTAKEVTVGFELWHANFHGHTEQYIYAQIPTEFTNDSTNKIKATITADGYSNVIHNKNNLQLEEKFLLNNSELPAGDYTLTVEILDVNDASLDELTETFSKPYDSVPKVGIDKNNAIRVNGELFFPVLPFLEGCDDHWANRYINALNGQGWYSEYNVNTWKDFLDKADALDMGVWGSGWWDGSGGRYGDPNKMAEYVTGTKDHNALSGWFWGDEPCRNEISSPVLRSRTYLSHSLDPNHLVNTNYCGYFWAKGDWKDGSWLSFCRTRRGYTYLYGAEYFGGKRTPVVDVIGTGYFCAATAGYTVEKLIISLEMLKEENYNLLPIFSYVEKCDINLDYVPTPEQIRMLAWLNVVHGMKAIKWTPILGHYTNSKQYAVMAEFLDHITDLTNIVLGDDTDTTVTDDADVTGNRVDTMIKDDGEYTWIIAARATERDETNTIDVTFTVSNLSSNRIVVEPGDYSQSIAEDHSDDNDDESRKEFTFTLTDTPITPGSIIIAGQYYENERGWVYLYDDGEGVLHGYATSLIRPTNYMEGTVNYTTGEIHVDFGQVKMDWVNWEDVSIKDGSGRVWANYRQNKDDRIITHSGDTFTDTFAPNAVHIYRLSLSGKETSVPVLASIGNKSVNENSALTFDVNATDADGDAITYSIQNKPSGATFEGQTFSWTPNYDQADTYPDVMFIASDGTTQDSEPITITVNNVNRPPVLAAIGDKSVNENKTLSFSISATDPDGDTIIYSLEQPLPSGAVFGSQTFTWTPDYSQAGIYDVNFIASDGQAQDSEPITITVINVNRLPVLNAIGNQSVFTDVLLTFAVNATDPDGETIIYSVDSLPSGATFASQTFNWTPDGSQADSYDVSFTASDGQGQDDEKITITVTADTSAPSVANCAPAVDSIQAPLNTLIILHVVDDGKGVDPDSVTINVNDNPVYSGNTAKHSSANGECHRIGTKANYIFIYQPKQNFEFDESVSVKVNAKDLADNPNPIEYSYSFKTEMRSFGRNKQVDPRDVKKGRPVTVRDSNGDIWAAWHAGVTGSRDIYIGKLEDGSVNFDSGVQLTNDANDQCNPVMAIGNDNKLYVAWQDNRRGNWDIYISTSNDWSAEIRVTDSNDNQINPAIVVDSSLPNNAYIVWEDDRNGNQDIYIAALSDGFVTTTVSQITSNGSDQVEPAIAADSGNTIYVVWTDTRNKGKNDIYGASSNDPWTNIPVVTEEDGQSSPAIAAEAVGSILHLVWVDDRTTNGDDDIFYAKTTGGLTPLTGSSIIDDDTGADQISPVIITTGTGEDLKVFACWRDERWADADLYAVEIGSGAGTNVFVGDDGTNSDQSEPAIGIDGHGYPYLVWTNERTDICYAGSTFIESELASTNVSITSEATVGTMRNAIQSVDDVSAEVPQGAYLCDVKVTVSKIKNPQKTPSNNRTFLYEFGPSGTTFSKPVTITIPYNATTLVSSPSAYWYNLLTGLYSQEGITDVEVIQISSGLYALRFKTTHFSIFGGGGSFGGIFGGGGGGGGGCSMSSNSQDSIAELLLPYIGLAVAMVLLKLRDRRKRKAHNITKSEC